LLKLSNAICASKLSVDIGKKPPYRVAFGNDFGNKGVVSLQTLVIPIDLAEEVCGELEFIDVHQTLQ